VGAINQPSNLADQIAELRRQIKNLMVRVGLSSATISSGSLTVKDGAAFQVLHPSGNYLLVIKKVESTGTFSFALGRDDGSAVFAEYLHAGGIQGWALLDHDNLAVVREDPSGNGLGRPYLDIPLYRSRVADWTSTTNGSFESLYAGGFETHHPCLGFSFSLTDSGATGELRLMIDGVQVGSTFTYSGPSWWTGTIPHGVSLHVTHLLSVEARRTGGAGALYVSPYYVRGEQTPS